MDTRKARDSKAFEGGAAREEAFRNVYQDRRRAAAYDELGIGGTYSLAFELLPGLLWEHASGKKALDFGCGTGRSTRFLKFLGLEVVGADISPEMVDVARARDPGGDYRVVQDGGVFAFEEAEFDLIVSAFTFDNVPGHAGKVSLFRALGELISPRGRIVNIVSTPEMYTNEWATFSTRHFPENATARPGDVVRIVTTDYSDTRPVDDILWPDEAYQAVYREAGLEQVTVERPLALGDEGIEWKSETCVPPWAVYVLRRRGRGDCSCCRSVPLEALDGRQQVLPWFLPGPEPR